MRRWQREEDGDAAEAAASPPPTFPYGIGFLCIIFNIVTLAELREQEKKGKEEGKKGKLP